MHWKLKEVAGILKRKPPTILVDTNNRPIIEKEQKQAVWKDYVTKMFENERSYEPSRHRPTRQRTYLSNKTHQC